MKRLAFITGIFLVLSLVALAQVPQVAPSAPVAQVQAPVVHAISVLQWLDGMIPSQIPAGVLAMVVMLIELLMRFVPTAQPRSILLLASQLLKIVAEMAEKISSMLDTIIQNISKPSA